MKKPFKRLHSNQQTTTAQSTLLADETRDPPLHTYNSEVSRTVCMAATECILDVFIRNVRGTKEKASR